MTIELMPSMDQIIKAEQLKKVNFWFTRFNFLKVINGIRPSRISYLLGTTGTGKSTLLASLIADATMDSPVLLIVSEESILRHASKILSTTRKMNNEHIKFLHEKMIPEDVRENQKLILEWLEMHIIEAGVRLVFWDNLTDSPLFSLRFGPAGQEWAVLKIRELCERLQVAFFIVIHTAKSVTDNMSRYIEGEDVRGTQQTFIGADFFFIFQRFTVGKVYYPFIRTVKHRDTDPSEKVHLLQFSNGVYAADAPSSYEEMNDVFSRRNVLGNKTGQRNGRS